jgi:hypothetical protein
MPDLPDSIQVLVKPATTATGTPLLESTDIPKGWDLEIIEQRRDGALVALSPDLNLAGLETSIDNYRRNERTPKGRLKRGSRPVFNLEQIEPSSRLLRIGDELALTDLQPNENYAIDVEIAAGREQPEGAQRRQSFAGYIRNGQAQIIGNGPIVGPDYAAYRVQASGQLISDMLDYHPWVTSVDLPPIVEREATELRNMDEPNLPDFTAPGADAPIIGVIDGGIIPEHPLIRLAVRDQAHRSFISDSILDEGAEGHGTAIVSLVALGSLRGALLNPPEPAVAPVRVALGRLLDRYTQIPTDVVAQNYYRDRTYDACREWLQGIESLHRKSRFVQC